MDQKRIVAILEMIEDAKDSIIKAEQELCLGIHWETLARIKGISVRAVQAYREEYSCTVMVAYETIKAYKEVEGLI